MRKDRLMTVISLFCLLVLGFGAGPVGAHGYLIRAIPADRSVLERPPTRIQYWFSESLEPRFSQINVRDVKGQIVASGGVDPNNTTALVIQIPPGTLSDGAYVVELRPAFASDSHAVIESRVFFVGTAASDLVGSKASTEAQPLEVLWKTLLILSTFLLFGVYAVYALVLLPAWGSAQHALGHLPPRLIRRLNALIIIGIVLAVAANIIALVQQTMTFFNVDAFTAISTDMWSIVRISSRAGDVWTLRMILLIALAALHGAAWYYRREYPFLLRPVWLGNVWLVALIIGLQAVTSHAAGALVQPWIAIAMHWTHSLAAAFWVGGIAVLVLILPAALRPYTGDERQHALSVVMRAFSRVVVGVVVLVMVSGIYNALNWFYTPQDVASTYGSALLLKLLMIGLLLVYSAAHHLALNPDSRAKISQRLRWPLLRQGFFSIGTLRAESLVGAAVLTAAALLSATPIPQPDLVQAETPALTSTQIVQGLTVNLSVSPGNPGINTFDIVVERDNHPLTDAQVAVQFVMPARDERSRQVTAEQVEQGLYVWSGDEIDRVGEWSVLLDITEASGARTRAVFAHTITESPSLIRPLSPVQAVALVIVVAVMLWIVWPTARAAALRMDWNPAIVVIAITTTVLTGVVMVAAYRAVEEQQRLTEEMLNPLPKIVNPVTPDDASIRRGETVYNALCRGWEASKDFEILTRQLDFVRDEELYRIPTQGWRSIPACTDNLTPEQTWDVVNYLRTRRAPPEKKTGPLPPTQTPRGLGDGD